MKNRAYHDNASHVQRDINLHNVNLAAGCSTINGCGFVGAVVGGRGRGVFSTWQPRYAEHNIPTFPVEIIERNGKLDKKPAVRHYMKIGLPYSTKLTRQFAAADALGFRCGPRSRIVIGDIDTTNENALADFLSCHGATPLIVRTASGKWHTYYRYNGERRLIRPYPDLPIDILGNGFVVAPPSRAGNGCYEIIQGSLDDLDRLPVMRNVAQKVPDGNEEKVPKGKRNAELLAACREHQQCHDEQEMVDFAMRWNQENCTPPDDDLAMVKRTAKSAWKYVQKHRSCMSRADEASQLVREPHVYALLLFLRAHNQPGNTFNVTDGLGHSLGWDHRRFVHTRNRLIELGLLVMLRPPYQGQPAVYRWGDDGRL